MLSAPQFIRALAALIVLSGGVCAGTTAWSQTTDSQSQSDINETNETAETDNAEASEDTSDKPSSNDEAEVAELDALVLGPWVIISEDATKAPSKDALDASIARCFEIPKLENLKIEPSAEKALPDARSLLGDLVYYRTETGLQRIDLKANQVVLFSEIRKVENEENKTFWAIRGETAGLALRFANANNRGGQGQFMLENERVYLRCGPGPNSKPKSDQDAAPTDAPSAE